MAMSERISLGERMFVGSVSNEVQRKVARDVLIVSPGAIGRSAGSWVADPKGSRRQETASLTSCRILEHRLSVPSRQRCSRQRFG
jgi:hypothetical protein